MSRTKDQTTGTAGNTPAATRRPRAPGGDSKVFRSALGAGTLAGASAEAAVDRAESQSAGAPMATPVQSSMEARFGRSFADVRVHNDSAAATAAGDLNARAFTVGSDVYFDKGAYQPDSQDGQHLLAHELAHVAQSGTSAAAKSAGGLSVSSPSDAAEREADAAADAVVRGESVPVLGSLPSSMVHRDGLGDLNEAVEGNWLLGASKSDVRRRISALSDDEGRQLATDPARADLLRRACAVLATARDLCWMFDQIPHFTFDRKAQILADANQLAAVTSAQWDTIIAAATEDERASIPSKISVSNAIADSKATPGALMALFGQVPYPVLEKRRLMDRTGIVGTMSEGHWALFWNTLDADAKTTLADTVACYGLIRAMSAVCPLPVVLMRFGEMPTFPILQKIQYFDAAGHIAALSQAQWEEMVIFTNPQQMLDMREDAAAYREFLINAPASLFGGWDWVQCVVTGAVGVDPADLKAGMIQLNPEQKETISDDAAAMRAVLGALGGAEADIFEVLINLGLEPKWIIYWLDQAGVIATVTAAHWGQIVGEAHDDEMLAVDGWADVKTLYETHCPEEVRQLRASIETNSTDVTDELTPRRIRELFDTLGPVGFLGAVAQDSATVSDNYWKVDRANYLRRTISGLPRGTAMGTRAHENLRAWFFDTGESRLNVIEAMFEARFNVNVEANRQQRRDHRAHASIRRWTAEGLKESWPQLERLPPDQVENNDSLDHYMRDSSSGIGEAYYWAYDDSVVMGLQRGDNFREQSDANVYLPGGQYQDIDPITGDPINQSPAVNTTVWNATIRHEIGHAVDNQLGVMTRWQGTQPCGGWTHHANIANFVQSIIDDHGGIGTAAAPAFGIPAADWQHYQAAMERAVTNEITLEEALTLECSDAGDPAPTLPVPEAGPMAAVYVPERCTDAGDGPWYGNEWVTTPAGRNYHRAYGSNTSLWSFDAGVRSAKMVSEYQWRAPGEWFAEAYQVYYVEQESDPNAPVGGVLRSRDPQAANLIANFVDRGYSPQEMRGGPRRDTAQRVDAPGSSGP